MQPRELCGSWDRRRKVASPAPPPNFAYSYPVSPSLPQLSPAAASSKATSATKFEIRKISRTSLDGGVRNAAQITLFDFVS